MAQVTFDQTLATEMATACLARKSRDMARVVTRIYDDALREHGVRASQLTMLVAIGLAGEVRSSALADMLDIEASTASRNLSRLRQQGWIASAADPEDGRGTVVRLTQSGAGLIDAAGPTWLEAQERGRETLEPIIANLSRTTST